MNDSTKKKRGKGRVFFSPQRRGSLIFSYISRSLFYFHRVFVWVCVRACLYHIFIMADESSIIICYFDIHVFDQLWSVKWHNRFMATLFAWSPSVLRTVVLCLIFVLSVFRYRYIHIANWAPWSIWFFSLISLPFLLFVHRWCSSHTELKTEERKNMQ